MKRRRPPAPITRAERMEMCRRYLHDQQPIRAIAGVMGRSYYAVWETLDRYKIPRRSTVPPRVERPPVVVPAEECALMAQMYHDGASIRSIAIELRRGTPTVRRVLVQERVMIRAAGFAPR